MGERFQSIYDHGEPLLSTLSESCRGQKSIPNVVHFFKGYLRLKIPPKTLPNCTEKVKIRVFDAQDHEDFIFDGPKPLFLTILAQK